MVRMVCPGCQSGLVAKDELIGQVRKCPKCGRPVKIVDPAAVAAAEPATEPIESPPSEEIHDATGPKLPLVAIPERLNRQYRYLICDKTKVIATWENDGRGWMLKSNKGLVSAARNTDKIPSQGDFKLVELHLELTGEGLRLEGLSVYQLAQRWALTKLERSEDGVLSTITGPGSLLREQKVAIRQHLGESMMREVWGSATQVLEYLANTDYHSHGPA
jgi:hypothetical protein